MHFEQSLKRTIYPPWSDQYIDYSKLKRLLHDNSSDAGSPVDDDQEWTEDDEGAFVDELVNVQLDKVASFHTATVQKLRDRAAQCEAKLDPIITATQQHEQRQEGDGAAEGPSKPPAAGQITLQEVLKELDGITKEVNELEKYSRINYTGFLKATKKHDRKRGHAYRVRPLMQVRLAELSFNNENYSPLLYRLSTMYGFVRQQMDGRDKKVSFTESSAGAEDFTTYKFWVHPDNLLELRTVILRRLPVLVYNPQTSKVAEGIKEDPSITSIYFDNPSFDLYSAKLLHDQSASSLRLRWYGALADNPEIYCEKKTVHQDNTSTEEKFTTKKKRVQPFLSDGYRMDKDIEKAKRRYGENSDQVEALQSQVNNIQGFIEEHELQPVVRANYTRTAFQIPGDSRVRITLDNNLALIREDSLDDQRPCREPNEWHRRDIDDPPNQLEWPFERIRSGEIVRFPFAVLEIRIRGSKEYEWVQDLMNSHLVKEAPRFSKFAHGVGTLFDDYVNQFPFWLSEVDTDIRKDPHQAFEEEQQRKQQAADNDFAVGSLLKVVSPQIKAKTMSPSGSPMSKPRSDREREKAGPDDTRTDPRSKKTRLQSISADEDARRPIPEIRDSRGRMGFITKYARFRKSRGVPLPEGVEKPSFWIKDEGPVKVEAKVWLANQRTFIKWQHVGILLSSLSLGLYNAAGQDNTIARTLGIIYTATGVFTALWGYGLYMWRSSLIQKRSGKDFDQVLGPVVVCLALAMALILNFGIKYNAVQERKRAGASSLVQNATVDTSWYPQDL